MDDITSSRLLNLVRLLVAIISFTGLLSLDVWKAWKSKAHWVPQGALVLSAFSIQLLDLLDTDIVSISDYQDVKEVELKMVVQNELLVDAGRVMVCVYMGYLVPELALHPSKKKVWSDIGALALTVSTHIFSELYVFKKLYWDLTAQNYVVNPLSIASRVCTMLSVILLFLLLGSAAFAGKTLSNLVEEKIPLALKEEPADYGPDSVKHDVLRSWVVTWVCKTDYVIGRSVLASSVGLVVTLSVGFFAAEWITQDYKVLHFDDGIDWFRYIVTGFMTFLILIGWSIIFSRWMFAICHFPGKYKISDQGYFHVEDFWTRHIFELMDDIKYPRPSWDQNVSGGNFIENLKNRSLRAIKAHVFLCRLLLYLQRLVILFSKLCCFLSEKILFVCKCRSRIVREPVPNTDFAGFQEAIKEVMMPGETQQSLFDGSLKALQKTRDFMEKGCREGLQSERLVQLLRGYSTDQNSEGVEFMETLRQKLSGDLRETSSGDLSFEYLKKFSWKMTALSLIRLIIKLEGRGANDAMDAYSEAYVFLDLLDNPAGSNTIFLPELFVRAADKQFIVMKKQLDRNQGAGPEETASIQEARQKVGELQENARGLVFFNPNDSTDWWQIAANNSLEKVCATIVENDTIPETAAYTDLMRKVRRLLADMLAVALRKEVARELVKNCRTWAEMLEDGKIRASVYIAGKLSGVIAGWDEVMQPEASDGHLGVGNCCGFNIGA